MLAASCLVTLGAYSSLCLFSRPLPQRRCRPRSINQPPISIRWQALASCVVFVFVAAWHDMNAALLTWGCLFAVVIVPEKAMYGAIGRLQFPWYVCAPPSPWWVDGWVEVGWRGGGGQGAVLCKCGMPHSVYVDQLGMPLFVHSQSGAG